MDKRSENRQLAAWVVAQRIKRDTLSDDKRFRLDALEFDWGPNTTFWEKMLAELVRYKDVHGDCNVPQKRPDNRKLASWVAKQRIKRDTLCEDKRSRLDALEFDWDPNTTFWVKMLAELVRYKEVHGDCNVPNCWPENPQLIRWVKLQRHNKDKLTDDRRPLLEALGFEWDPLASKWENMFAALARYKDAHGDCNVSHSWAENKKLASWVANQRTGAKKGNLTDERRQRLEAIDFRF